MSKQPSNESKRMPLDRVKRAMADAIRAETKIEKRELEAEAQGDATDEPGAAAIDPWQEVNEQMDVERVLALVADDQKRLAFRLYMEGVPNRVDEESLNRQGARREPQDRREMD
jgi:hypothetical protein